MISASRRRALRLQSSRFSGSRRLPVENAQTDQSECVPNPNPGPAAALAASESETPSASDRPPDRFLTGRQRRLHREKPGPPFSIHIVKWTISSSGSFPVGGILNGSCWRALSSRLSSGLSGTTAAPLSPPRRMPSRESRNKPPFRFFFTAAPAEWHSSQWVTRTGRIFASKEIQALAIGVGRIQGCISQKDQQQGPSSHGDVQSVRRPGLRQQQTLLLRFVCHASPSRMRAPQQRKWPLCNHPGFSQFHALRLLSDPSNFDVSPAALRSIRPALSAVYLHGDTAFPAEVISDLFFRRVVPRVR